MTKEEIKNMTDEEIDRKCYQVFARKDLSFGCIVNYYWEILPVLCWLYRFAGMRHHSKDNTMICYENQQWWSMEVKDKDIEILGHPPMLWCIVQRIYDNTNLWTDFTNKEVNGYYEIFCNPQSNEWYMQWLSVSRAEEETVKIIAMFSNYNKPLTEQSRECKEYCLFLACKE